MDEKFDSKFFNTNTYNGKYVWCDRCALFFNNEQNKVRKMLMKRIGKYLIQHVITVNTV